MKGRVIATLLLSLVLLAGGCGGGANTQDGNTYPPGVVPPPAELEKQGFLYPDLPRISGGRPESHL